MKKLFHIGAVYYANISVDESMRMEWRVATL